MSAFTEQRDPDELVHAAWMAEISKQSGRLRAEQVSSESSHRALRTLKPARDSIVQQVPRSKARRKYIRFLLVLCAFIAVPLALFGRSPLALFGRSDQSAIEKKVETAKLTVMRSVGPAGAPISTGLSLQGDAPDAIVIISGLVPGMELSAGTAIGEDTWQVPAADLRYTSIAPPPAFVGSAGLVAELRLPNGHVVDRQAIRVEWIRSAPREQTREELTFGQGGETAPAIRADTEQHPNQRGALTAPAATSIERSKVHIDRKHNKSAGARSGNKVTRFGNEGNRSTLSAIDHKPTVKGFWDWSR
jgi:hypothetical protein